ncbi:unnamed protein product [Closterium sp. Yama58-4]|nr:unnamed protein product [Closterium sp. Yama58-4]
MIHPSRINFFDSLHLRGVGLAKVIVRRPQLLSSSLDATWQLLIRYLSLLGLTSAQIGEMVVRHPKVLQLTVQADVSPKVRFLRLIGIPEADVAGVLHRFPPILTYSLDKKIRPLVRFLVTEAGVPDHEVWKVVVARPDLVACHLDDRLRPLVRFLLSMGIVREDVGSMVVQFPPLLKYNPAILKPKWRAGRGGMASSASALSDVDGGGVGGCWEHGGAIPASSQVQSGYSEAEMALLPADYEAHCGPFSGFSTISQGRYASKVSSEYNPAILRPKWRYFQRTVDRLVAFPRSAEDFGEHGGAIPPSPQVQPGYSEAQVAVFPADHVVDRRPSGGLPTVSAA